MKEGKWYRYLGWASGWRQAPKIVIKCRAAKHDLAVEDHPNCKHTVTCDECGYIYKYDSSG